MNSLKIKIGYIFFTLFLFVISANAQIQITKVGDSKTKKKHQFNIGDRLAIQYFKDGVNIDKLIIRREINRSLAGGLIKIIEFDSTYLKAKRLMSKKTVIIPYSSIHSMKRYRYINTLALMGVLMIPTVHSLNSSSSIGFLGLPLEVYGIAIGGNLIYDRFIDPYKRIHPKFQSQRNGWNIEVISTN